MNTNNKLSDKIASAVGLVEQSYHNEDDMGDALKVASQCLKLAATKQRKLEEAIEKLASVNEQLERNQRLIEKKAQAEEIVGEMVKKGLARRSETNEKIAELMVLDDEALLMFGKTVLEVPEKVANDCISDLTFLYNNNNIKEKDKSMSKAISSLIGG